MAVTHDLTIRDVDSDSVDVLVRVSMIIDNLTKDQDVDLLDKFPDDLLFIVEMWVGRMEMAEAAGRFRAGKRREGAAGKIIAALHAIKEA